MLRQKQSHYHPDEINLGYGNLFHAKELSIRLFFGYFIGAFASTLMFGVEPPPVFDAETEEILSD